MFGSSQLFASQGVSFGDSQAPAAAPSVAAEPAAKRPRAEEKQSVLAVTIRQMEVAVAKRADTGEDLKFYGAEPNTLVLVACVETVAHQGTNFEMTLNDGSGRMKARYFSTDASPSDLEAIKPGRYISCFGSVRTAPAVHFAVLNLRLVESADEVSYHTIEVAHSALRLQLLERQVEPAVAMTPSKTAAAEGLPAASPEKPPTGAELAATPAEPASPSPTAQAPSPPPKPAGGAALSGADLRAALLGMMREVSSPEGVNVDSMVAKFSPVTEADVRAALEQLVGDGEIFGTIDDNHFAVV